MNDDGFIPNRNGDNFRDHRSPADEERAMFQPHWIVENGRRLDVYPGYAMTMGQMRAEGSEHYQPTIRMDASMWPVALVFVPSAAELRVLGEAMIRQAGEMEAAADAMLAQTLAKKPGA